METFEPVSDNLHPRRLGIACNLKQNTIIISSLKVDSPALNACYGHEHSIFEPIYSTFHGAVGFCRVSDNSHLNNVSLEMPIVSFTLLIIAPLVFLSPPGWERRNENASSMSSIKKVCSVNFSRLVRFNIIYSRLLPFFPSAHE